MKFKKVMVFGLVLSCLILQVASILPLAFLSIAGSFAGKMYNSFGTLAMHANKGLITKGLINMFTGFFKSDDRTEMVLVKLEKIDEKLTEMSERMDYKVSKLGKALANLPTEVMINEQKQDLADWFAKIDQLYSELAGQAHNRSDYNTEVLEANCEEAIEELPDIVGYIENTIVPTYAGFGTGLFDVMARGMAEQESEACGSGESPDYQLYNMYVIVVMLNIKALATICSAYEYWYRLHNETTRPYIDDEIEDSEVRLKKYADNIVTAMNSVPRFIRTCDPPKHSRGKTYAAFDGAIQTFLINDKNYHLWYDSCYGDCEEIGDTYQSSEACYDDHHLCWNLRPCHGRIHACWTIVEDGTFCFDTNGTLPQHVPRYQWFKNKDYNWGKTNEDCRGYTVQLESWLYNARRCNWCACTCIDNKPKSQAIYRLSYEMSMADYQSNKAVIGAKFTLKDDIIHVQVKQGEVLASGNIKAETGEWVEIPDGLKERLQDEYMNPDIAEDQKFKYGILDIGKSLKLNDFLVPKDRVVVGVGLYCEDLKCTSNQYRLRVAHAKYNYTTGEIDKDAEVEILDDPEQYTDEVFTQKNNNPVKVFTAENNKIHSRPKQFIRIEKSSMEEDFAQWTLPFFDCQPLEFNPPIAAGGVGLYHRSSIDSSGFVGLRLFPMDLGMYRYDELADF